MAVSRHDIVTVVGWLGWSDNPTISSVLDGSVGTVGESIAGLLDFKMVGRSIG